MSATGQASGNHDGTPGKYFFAGLPAYAPSTLFWVLPNAETVVIEDLGSFIGYEGAVLVEPECMTAYQLQGTVDKVVVNAAYPGEYHVVEQTFSGQQSVTTDKIMYAENVVVESAANVTFFSNSQITLGKGFHVKNGGKFHASVNDAGTCR